MNPPARSCRLVGLYLSVVLSNLSILSGFVHSTGLYACQRSQTVVRAQTPSSGAVFGSSLTEAPVVIFPAQFGTKKDYTDMIAELNARGHPAFAIDIGRFGWLRVAQAIPTAAYWQGVLEPQGTLDFYFEAAQKAIEQVKVLYPDRRIHLVAHSIGGWVARAFVGEVASSEDVQHRFISLTTLGTPNLPASGSGFWAQVDQTRGLLKYVNDRFPGAFHPNLHYLSVGGLGTQGKLGGGVEESIAYISYLPLCGRGETIGDGIIPEEVAFLEGSRQLRLPGVKHSNFVPTAGPSIRLGERYLWYGSPEVVDNWLQYLPKPTAQTGKQVQS